MFVRTHFIDQHSLWQLIRSISYTNAAPCVYNERVPLTYRGDNSSVCYKVYKKISQKIFRVKRCYNRVDENFYDAPPKTLLEHVESNLYILDCEAPEGFFS